VGINIYYSVETEFCQVFLDKMLNRPYNTNMAKELTTKQQTFLDNLVTAGGDPRQAAELAGYSSNSYYQVVKSLKHEIIDLASGILSQSAPKAAMKLVEVMNSDAPIPQANMKLQAAQTILDRTGLGKQERLDVTTNVQGGLFILPAKGMVIDNA
jgi:hypothetical protein